MSVAAGRVSAPAVAPQHRSSSRAGSRRPAEAARRRSRGAGRSQAHAGCLEHRDGVCAVAAVSTLGGGACRRSRAVRPWTWDGAACTGRGSVAGERTAIAWSGRVMPPDVRGVSPGRVVLLLCRPPRDPRRSTAATRRWRVVLAVVAVSSSAPLVAFAAAPALAVAFWRNLLSVAVLGPFSLARRRAEFRALTVGAGRREGVVLRAVRGGAGRALRHLDAQRQAHLGRRGHRAGRHPAGLAGADRPRARAAGCRGASGSASGWRSRGAVLATGADFAVSGRAVRRRPARGGRRHVRRRLHRVRRAGPCHHQHHHLHHRLLRGVRADPAGRLPGRRGAAERLRRPAPGWRSLALVVGAQLLGHSMFNYALRRVSATTVSVLILLEAPGCGADRLGLAGAAARGPPPCPGWRCCSPASPWWWSAGPAPAAAPPRPRCPPTPPAARLTGRRPGEPSRPSPDLPAAQPVRRDSAGTRAPVPVRVRESARGGGAVGGGGARTTTTQRHGGHPVGRVPAARPGRAGALRRIGAGGGRPAGSPPARRCRWTRPWTATADRPAPSRFGRLAPIAMFRRPGSRTDWSPPSRRTCPDSRLGRAARPAPPGAARAAADQRGGAVRADAQAGGPAGALLRPAQLGGVRAGGVARPCWCSPAAGRSGCPCRWRPGWCC